MLCGPDGGSMTQLYHITHLRNLPGIIASGGLCCDRWREQRQTETIGIAHQHIKARRKKRCVNALSGKPVAAGGTLWDYVPFYFAPRSPMLYTIHRGNVEGYSEGQRPIIHLVSSVETLCALGKAYAFSDGHAEMTFSELSDEIQNLGTMVDWDVMRSEYWSDTAEQPDRKRRRQAEFLMHEFVPWTAIEQIGVIDKAVEATVQLALERVEHRPMVVVESAWYY